MKKLYTILITIMGIIHFTSCRKFLDAARPDGNISNSEAFSNDGSANAVAINIYAEMANAVDYPTAYLSRYMGLYTDELERFNGISIEPDASYFKCAVMPSDRIITSFWSKPFNFIFQCNNILENLAANVKVSDTMKSKLMGEARFLRAFHYFYLVNIFGEVPEITEKNYRQFAAIPRQRKDLIWQLIINDLTEAVRLLPIPTSVGDTALLSGIRASKWAAKALLARVHLYRKDWKQAVHFANELIGSGNFQLEHDLLQVFLIKSRETIFQMQSSKPVTETLFFLPSATSIFPLLVMRPELYNSFEQGDLRRAYWTQSGNQADKQYASPYKYRERVSSGAVREYKVVMRLAEMYLIRAEANAHLGQLYGPISAAADLNILRSRAGLPGIPGNLSKQEILQKVEQERKLELFSEWGHRWFDLKRTNSFTKPDQSRAEELLGLLKPGFAPYKLLFPVPQEEQIRNPSLSQNPGY